MDLHRLGKYEIVGKIGQGAMGEVYRAHDPILNRDVAIKTMSAAIGADDELRKRFHREAQSAARLNHPNIITVYDFGEEQGKIYMAMELLEGNDLKDLIGRHTPMTLDQKMSLIEQIAEGLAFAHAKDVVHRDLKPANIHIQPNGQIKIMDFGLAKLASSDMTRAGMIMGTPNYMSPEQVRGEKADSRSDVFSLGAVFYELLANRKPFEADSLHAVLFQVMQNEPEPLMRLVPDIPPLLAQVVEKAMSKDSALRYRDASELRDALRQVRTQSQNWSMVPQPAPDLEDATVIGKFDAGMTAPPTRQAPSWPPRPAPASYPPTPTPVAARSHPPAPSMAGHSQPPPPMAPYSSEATTLQPPPAAPAHYETEATTLQPPPPGMRGQYPPPPPPPHYDVEATTVQPAPPAGRLHPGTPLPVARPVPPTQGMHALEPQPGDAHRRASTLSGHAPTHVPGPTPPPAMAPTAVITPPSPPRPAARPAPPPSPAAEARPGAKAGLPMPVLAGAGVLALALAAGAYFVFKPGTAQPSPTPAAEATQDPRVLQLQVQLAEKLKEDKDFRGAMKQAEEVLAKDPANADAKRILEGAQKSIQEVEQAINDTRRAIDSGDVKTASEGLQRIFALDPANPAAAEFSGRLNQFFRSQAETARKEMGEAQRTADRMRASAQADYGAAAAVGREAEGLYGKGEFAQATRKFIESRDAYERARRSAERAARTPSVAPTTTTMVAVETTVPSTTMAAVVTPEPPPPPPVANDESVIREMVQQFERAMATKDPGLLKTLKPDLSGKEQDALRRSPAVRVDVNLGTLRVQGDRATAMIARTDTLGDGKVFNIQQTLIFTKKGDRWVIQKIVSQQVQ